MVQRTVTSLRLAVGAVLVAQVANAQKVPELYLAPELTIPAKALAPQVPWPLRQVSVLPGGRMIAVAKSVTGIGAFANDGKSLNWNLKIGWRDDNDIAYVERLGVLGNRVWISDGFTKQVVFLDGSGKIVDATPYPSWVHPRYGEWHTYPLFGAMGVVAVYPNGDLLAEPRGVHTVFETKGYNPQLRHFLRIQKDGTIIREIARFDSSEGRLVLRSNESSHTMLVPFFARTFWQAADDGSRVILARPGTSVADSGSIQLVAIGESGDTVFSKRYEMPAVRVPQTSVDSMMKSLQGFGKETAADVRAKVSKQTPQFKSFLVGVHLGADKSTWLIQRSVVDTSKMQTALVIDEQGNVVARTTLSDSLTVLAVDRSHLWAAVRTHPALVRFTLQATPPRAAPQPRSGSAARDRD
jgi:hypothetical protein